MGLFNRMLLLLGSRNGYDLKGTLMPFGLWMGGRDLRKWIEPEKIPDVGATFVEATHRLNLIEAWSYLKAQQTYISDEVKFHAKEHWQSVEEYQADFRGDYEDSAIWLLSALIKHNYAAFGVIGFYGGYWKRRAWLKGKETPYNHVWVMVWLSGKPWLLETTDKTAMPIRADVDPQHIPVYSWNRTEVFVHKEKR